MATIRKTLLVAAPVDRVWDALRDFAAVHERLAPGFVIAAQLDGESCRVVTFFNGLTAREQLVSCDDATRRLVYAVVGGRLSHHNAAAEVSEDGPGRTRFVWTTDLLPDAMAPAIEAMMTRGAEVMKDTLERAT